VPGYLIELANGEWLLIDTGFPRQEDGDGHAPCWFRVTPEDHVIKRLESMGLDAAAVQYVVCSHFDPDHCGANDLFPQAQFFVQRRHYEVARTGTHDRFEVQRSHWESDALNYRMIDGDEEVVPGVTVIETGGHVPGHQSVLVRLKEFGKVLLAVDAIPTAASADPLTYKPHRFDMDPDCARRSIGKLQALARSEEVREVVYGHDKTQWAHWRKAPEGYE
jgi:N-acyl homoserine lactone hydrolase